MLKKLNKKTTLITGIIAGVLFCIPTLIYIRSANYENTWMLYMGSFLFMVTVWIHTMLESKRRDNNESTIAESRMLFFIKLVKVSERCTSSLAKDEAAYSIGCSTFCPTKLFNAKKVFF